MAHVRTLLSIWTWFEIASVVIFGFFVQLALFALTAPFDRRRYVAGRFLRKMATTAVKLCPLWHFRVYGEMPEQTPRRMIVVGNHCSHTDVFLISHLPWEMKWLAKAELFRVPFLGWCLRLAGDVAVVRGERDSAKLAMDRCKFWLDRGMPVFIFPEGTRSETGEMRAFKDGAFRLALETGAPMLPVAVAGTHLALRKHDWRFGDARAHVTVGTPIVTEGRGLDEVEALKDEVRAEIERLRAIIVPISTR